MMIAFDKLLLTSILGWDALNFERSKTVLRHPTQIRYRLILSLFGKESNLFDSSIK